ncbi:MAG: endonuclease III [Candidatus Aminicenantes bacterium]|nr:endonuclease III [Candidatus Aminicenantes bacterium]
MESIEQRVPKIIDILRQLYPRSQTALKFKNPLQILVATVLSAQCTDKKVNEVTPGLFKKYSRVEDFAEADLKDLEKEIRSTGFYRNKSKNIRAAAQKMVADFSGKVPSNMSDLLTLPGVARKTANIVLSSAFHKAQGIAVDTHVKRLSQRLGLSDQKNPDKIEQDLMKIVPKEEWLHFNYRLVNHGRKICQARKPLCDDCRLSQLCLSADLGHS